MLSEEGIVERIIDRKARVRVQKGSGCAHCESRGACHFGADEEVLMDVLNELQAEVGDHVEVSVSERSLMKLSILVYLLPILALILGAYLGGAGAGFFHLQSTSGSVLGGILFMAIAIGVLIGVDRAAESEGKHQPRMTRILSKADHSQPEARIQEG